jgi:DNA invertase Pin-like site-specific DNA recombinase
MACRKNLSEEIINEIRSLYSAGTHNQQQIADRFKLSQSTVCKIINNNIHRKAAFKLSGQADTRMGYRHGHL